MSAGQSNNVYTYAGYELVEQAEEFEYKHKYFYYLGFLIEHKLMRRTLTTMTWEATLQDAISGAPSAYNHNQGYPSSVNPGNLSEAQGWRLQSVEYTKSLSVPMSKDVRETWIKTGQWEVVEDLLDNSTSV